MLAHNLVIITMRKTTHRNSNSNCYSFSPFFNPNLKWLKHSLMLAIFSLMFSMSSIQAQDVAICGFDASDEEFTFVLLRDFAAGEVIYFTEDEYISASGNFATGEGHISYTVPAGGLTENTVIGIEETGTDTFSEFCGPGGTITHLGGSWSYSGSDELYAFSASTAATPWTSVTEVHSFYYGSVIGYGAAQDPEPDHPDVVILQPNLGDGAAINADFNDAARVNTTQAIIEDKTNWTTNASGITLSCTDFTNQMIGGPAGPTVTCSSTPVQCDDANGSSDDGTATASAMDGTPPLSYAWSNGQTTATATGLAAGMYTVTVTDDDSNTATCVATVAAASALTVACSSTDVQCDDASGSSDDGTATATPSGGAGSNTYVWSNGGTTQTITGLAPGMYTVTVTDANGCFNTCTATVAAASALTVACSSTDVQCDDASGSSDDGTATATPSGGAGSNTYVWSNGGTTQTITGLAAGMYTVTVTDANGCFNTCTATVGAASALTVACSSTDVQCDDANGISDDGTATATPSGGAGSNTYVWSNGGTTQTITGLAAGMYTVTVTDANGCFNTCTATVAAASALTVACSSTDVQCDDASGSSDDGTATATPSGGAGSNTYVWSNGGTTQTITGLAAGMYTVTVTDANGCFSSCSATVGAASALTVACSSTDVQCDDANGSSDDGTATATPSGGAGSNTYVWSNGGTTQTITGLAAGMYTVTVTDANGCMNSCTATVGAASALTVACSSTDVQCDDASGSSDDGTATATPSGGAGSNTYVWSNGGTTQTITGLAAGMYTVTVTDANGCINSCTATVAAATPLVVTFTDDPVDACVSSSDQMGLGDGMPAEGTEGGDDGVYSGPGVTDNNDGTYDFSPSTAGIGIHTITYTYTSASGCTNSATVDVEVYGAPNVTFTDAPMDACVDAADEMGLGDGMPAEGTEGGDDGVYSGPGVTDNNDGTYDFSPSTAGVGVHTITYTYTDGGGCSGMATVMVEVFDLPVVTLMAPMDVCITSGVMTFNGGSPSGGVYSGPGVTDNANGMDYDFDPTGAGIGMHTIAYDFTDMNGCSNSATAMINVTPPIPVSLTIPPSLDTLCIDNGLEVIANAGSPAGGVYSGPGVTDDANGMSFTYDPAAAGSGLHLITYTVSGMGCSGMFTDFIHVFDLPVVTFSIPAAQDSFCISAAPEVISGGAPPGGVYSGPGVTDDGNGTSFTFDAGAAGVGFHILTYTFTDAQGCSNSFDDFIQVFPLPVISYTAPADLCIDAGVQAGLGGATPAGGVYSGDGVTDNGNGMDYDFDPMAAGVGVHTITYTFTDMFGCENSATDDVEVYDLPIVDFTALADLCVDAGVQSAQGGGTPTGGVYSGPGVTDNSNGMDYDFDPMAAGVGVHTITYTYTDGNGCVNSATDDVEVFDLPTITFTALADLCIDAGVQSAQGGGTPTGGVYSGPGVTDNSNGMDYDFDPATAGVGVHTITYTYTDANGCENSASDDVEVFDLPVVTFMALADLCIDAGVQSAQGGGTPTGGAYSGAGVTDNGNGMDYDFDPMVAGVGVHTITYTYTDTNGCENSATDDVEVFDLPVVDFTALADLCIDAGVQSAQSGGTPTGGAYSGTGVTDDGNGMTYSFDPAAAGAGVHTITYTYTDGNGCENSASDDVEVFDLPVVTFTALADQCIDAGVQSAQGGGTPTGGVYSGSGVTDNGNGMDYDFDPATAGAGVHTITYTYTDGNGCENSASDDVEVFDLPVVTFTALADLCIDAGVQSAQGGGTPTGGAYSGAGVTDNGNGMDYDFDPMVAGVGVHTITYTYTDSNGCENSATDDVEVFDLPVVDFTALADLCIDAGVQSAQGGGTPTGGTYSGTGVTDNGNGMDYDFDPMVAGVGVHTITYTYTDGNGCENSASDDVEVFDLPTVTFTALADLCIDAGVQSAQGGGTPTGGVYSGTGVTDNGNGMDYDFDPATAGVGVHTITYTYTDGNGCENSASDDVEVFDLPVVTFMALADLCVDAGVQSAQGGGTPTGGTYSGAGVTDNGNGMDYDFDPMAAGVGVHTITYTYTDSNGCENSATDDVEVFDLPVVDFTALADLCIDAGVQSAQGGGTPTGGTYSGTGVTDNGNGMDYDFDPMVAGVGVHTITYTYTDGNGCENSASDDVEVFDLPTVTFTALADLCIDAGVQSAQGGGTPTGGVYSGPGVTDNGNGMDYDFDPATAGAGVHTITYTYTDGNGCENSATDDVEVFDLPVVDFTALADLCVDAGVQSAQGGGTPTGGTYSGAGVTDNGNGMDYDFDPMAAGVGVHTITYTYTDGNGCENSATDDVEVFDLPVVDFTALADLCIDAGVQSAQGGGTPTGGTYSGTGVTDNGNGMDYDFDPMVAGVGVHTITYTYTDGNGCENSASDDVEVFDLPTVTFTALADLCIDAGVQSAQGGGTPTGGVYSGTGVTDNGNGMDYDFDPATAGVGVHTITYTYTDGNGCENSASDDVEVFDLPVVTFMALADLCVDAGVQSAQGGGTPTGGTYSGTGVTDNGNGMDYDFDPATAGVGVHTITYTYTDGNGCENSATDDVEVFDLPVVDFTALADLCIDAGVQSAQSGGTPTGGVYSGTGVTDDGNGMTYSFDPAAAGVGVHTITYDYTDANGCSNSATDDVEVFDLPTVTFTALDDLCIDAGIQTGLSDGVPAGGVYSGTGVTDDGNGMTYSFDPAVAGIGVHTITYTYNDTNGCTGTFSDDVEVFDLPMVDFTALDDICINEGIQTGLGGGTPTGGVYSGAGVTDDGNGMTYTFDPEAATAGTHTLTYTYTDANGCTNSASDDVEVFGESIVTLTGPDDLCEDAGIQTGLNGGTPPGGIYSGPGVTDDSNGMTYSFDPATAGVGVHTITYTFVDINGCMTTAMDDVEVFEAPVVTFTAPADLCINDGIQTGLGGGTPTGGVYSGIGVTDDGNGMTYSFDPTIGGAGTYTITYTFTTADGCVASASDDVEVFGLSIIEFTALADLCLDAGVQTGLGGATPTGGTYSGAGVTDDGNGMTYSFDPAAAGAGVHTLTYTFTDTNGCTNSEDDDVEVFDLPVVAFTAPMDVCVDAGVQAGLGGGTPTGGVYSGPGVTDDGNGMTYSFDPAAAGVGVHTITYDYTDSNGCSNSASDDVEVFDLPTVAFTALDDLCIDAGVQTMQGMGVPPGGVYSGPGVTDNGNGLDYDFDPAAAGVGVHTITYTYNDSNGCTGAWSDDVEVFDLPVVDFTALADLCLDAGVQAGLGGGTPTGGVYSGTGVTDDGNGMTYSFDPAAAGAGVHTITYDYTDANGCMNSATDDVEVFDLPVVAFTAPMDVCIDAGVQAGLGGGTPTGGTYSGTGVTDDGNGMTYSFDPAAAGVGVHTITYDYTDSNGCSGTASDDVEVFDLPTVAFTALDDLCIDAGIQTMQGMGVPPGGVYSGPGVTDNGNGLDYDFDPAAAGVGVHTITYTYNDSNGCTGAWSDDVEVFDLPVVDFTALADLCIDAGVQTGQGGGTPTGGVYSGTGVTDDGNGMTYSFDPAAAGAGVHTITYDYTDSNGCSNSATDDVEVFDLPVVAFTAPMDLCIDAGVQAGLGGGTPSGGTYSGTGVTDDGNGMTYSFDPAAAGIGVHTITYDYTDANGCSGTASDDVEVLDLPVVTLATVAGYCLDAPIQGAPITGGSPAGGVYSGIGVTDGGNGTSYNFDPTVNGPGIVTITYTYTDANGCTNSAMSDIEIYECAGENDFEPEDPCSCLDNATIFDMDAGTGGDDGQFSEVVTVSNASGAPLPSGQTWTVVGATGAWDAFNVPAIGVQSAGIVVPGDGSVVLAYNAMDGVYDIPFVHVDDIGYTLMIEGPFPMGSAANVTLTISNKCQYPNPVFDPTIPDMINTMDPVITLGGTDTNGGTADGVTFTLDGSPATEIDPSALAMGTHTVTMTYDGAEDGNGGISPDGGTTSASPGCIQEVTKDFEIVVCDLVVDCSNIVDETLACRADLPPVDFDLPMVTDSCGDVIRSALTIIPGNSGCPGDTVFITRTYFLQDQNGNMAECMQTFTVISTMDPSFTFFPADTTVLCGADTSPAVLGMAEGTQECPTFNGMEASVTFNDVTTPGACPAESTITRTWTVTDGCGRTVDMDQTIMVVDTIAPTVVCQDITVELDANGMATASADDVNNGSSDNCGGTVSLSLNMDMFTCANLGANDVWLIGEDECGNIDSCMAVITVEDNIAPTITCPGDIEMDNDPGICGAVVTFDVMGDDNCDFTITQTAGIPSGGLYPVGETMNTYMIEDAAGATAECSFLVTVNDVEGPVVDCPNDIGVQLEAGECEEIVFFDIPFMDNCGTIDGEMSQAVNEALVSTALDCANNTSNHLRYFENNLPVPVEITQVNFGIFNSGTAETVTINIYTISPSAAFEYGNMNLAATVDYAVPAGMNNVILTAMIEASIPVGMNYVLELRANNTTNFVIGYNDLGETESTYIAGNNPVPCVSLEPVDIDVLGFGAFAVILFSDAEGGPSIEQTGGLPSGSYFPLGTTTNTFVVTDVYGNTTDCEFDVTLVEFENGVTGVMACNDNINVSLDMDCEVVLEADMLLEGDVYGCYDDYIINVSGGVVGNVITEPGTYTVTITDPDTGNSCWSTINVEDKRAPILEDCACPVGGTELVTPFEGTLDNNDPIWTRPFVAGGACNPSGAGIDIPYDTYNFALDMDANLNAEVVTFTAPSGDSFLALYEESFDPTDPCGNLVITNDDGGVGLLSQFDAMLNTGTTYILVVTTFNNNGNDYGDYVVEMTSDATLLEIAEECDFRCVDIEYIMGSDDLTPNPTVIACSEYETFFTDELTVDANGNQIILRTWLAQNENGSSTCTQQFNIAPIQISELTLPISPVILSCNDGTSPEEIVAIFDNPLTQDNPNTSYVENNEGYVYAYPTYLINGHPQKVDNQVCDVYAAYTDQELDACEEGCNGNRKVIRTWTLVDWNTLEVDTYVQTIKAVDTDAPTLITQDVTVSTDAWGCEASFEAPLPWELHDNCDSYPEYYITGPAGVTIEGSFEEGYVISGAPKGTHTFNYIAYDCCGNEASYPFTVTVIDSTPPVVVAKQNVVISVTSGSTNGAGLAKLYAESIDNGSYDGCSNEVKLEVRRDEDNCDIRGNATYNADGHPQDGSPNPNSPSYDPDGGAYVKFCCEDLTNATVDVNGDGELDAGHVKVWLRVWDDGDMDGIYGTAGDNYNEAWAYVKVEDKLAPAITCPPDVTLTCDMDYTDLNMTGSASAYGSCGGVDVEYNDIIINLNTCNEGFVRRRWSVVGRSDIFCDQTITMDELDAPVNVSFSQVGDFTAANCPDMIALGEPTWIAGPCDVMGYTMETDTFFFEDGACYKLVNHYTVINWCDYEPNNPFWDGEGLWEHVQVIKVTDETQPVIEDCDDKMYAINDHSDSDDDGEVCEAMITLTNVATDPGSANCPTGWLKWQVLVDLWGDGTVDLEYSSFLPPFDTQFNDTNGNGIPDVYLSPTANGETVSVPLPDIVGSMSNHKVSWKVTDGCNNVTTCDTEFMVVDKKAPTPYCVDLSTAVMESSGTVELWAIDFNVGSFDNCTAQEDLRYTFSDVAPEDDPNYDDTQSSSSMTFDCSDVDNSPVEVNMYVWDEKGNADFCVVYLTLVDNTGACGQKPDIAGTVATETGVGVEEVEVTLEASLPEYPRLEMTDENGEYVFVENALNATYQLSGSKDVDYLNGVSTLDLVKIQRHILGLEELNSPYKLVAADINGDTEIKAHDLVELRKLILGIITDLPTNESWRFVNSEQELTMDMDLADVDYSQEVENLQTNTMSKDFVAVKIGDVTEDAQANLTGNTSTAVRSNKTLSLNILNQEVEAGQTVSVGFTSEEFAEVFGYQFTMELNGLEFAGIESGVVAMNEGNVGVLSSNVVTMSYNSSTAVSAGKDETIFTVKFVAKTSGNLSNMIDITSKVTNSEAYVSTSIGETLEIRNVVIEMRGNVVEVETSELYQNEPNPFKTQTTIGYRLAAEGKVNFTVHDVTGKVLINKSLSGVRGYNEITLKSSDIAMSGVLYYTLESGEFTATKKMIILE